MEDEDPSAERLRGDIYYDKTTTAFLRLRLQPNGRANGSLALWLSVVSLPADMETLYLKAAHLKVCSVDGQTVVMERNLTPGPVPARIGEQVWGWKDLWQGSSLNPILVSYR